MNPKEWAALWKKNTHLLEQAWVKDLRESNVAESIKNLDNAFKYTMNESTLRASSGLVEMQRIIKKYA